MFIANAFHAITESQGKPTPLLTLGKTRILKYTIILGKLRIHLRVMLLRQSKYTCTWGWGEAYKALCKFYEQIVNKALICRVLIAA